MKVSVELAPEYREPYAIIYTEKAKIMCQEGICRNSKNILDYRRKNNERDNERTGQKYNYEHRDGVCSVGMLYGILSRTGPKNE